MHIKTRRKGGYEYKPTRPTEPDYSMIYKDYAVKSDNYADVYQFGQLLDKVTCERTEYPQDWFSIKDGVVRSNWIIFVCAFPKDMERLECVAKRLGLLNIQIVGEYDEDDLNEVPFK